MPKIHAIIGFALICFLSSCCSRPYSGGVMTWPQRQHNIGPDIETRVAIYSVQKGSCPDPDSRDLNVKVSIEDNGTGVTQRFKFRAASKLGEISAKWRGRSKLVLANDEGSVFATLIRDSNGHWSVAN